MRTHFILFSIAVLFCTTLASAQEVVINKFYNNLEKDSVELLVITNHLDMRGMILKDFARDVDNVLIDSGGVYRFADVPLWSSLPAGTLIVLYRDGNSIDTDTKDFVLKLALSDTQYFEHVRGKFDIRSDGEILMLKRAGASDSWMEGSIHAFGCASLSKVIQDTVPKPFLYVTRNASTDKSIIAKTSTRKLSDYNGKDGDSTSSFLYGSGNTESNTAFIDSLRSVTDVRPSDPPVDLNFFSIVPNPAQNDITLRTEKRILSVAMFDMLGRQVFYRDLTGQPDIFKGATDRFTLSLSLRTLPEGVVLLRARCEGKTHDRLLMIQR